MKRSSYRTRAVLGSALALVLLALPYGALAEGTHINPPSNRYSPSDDVQVGQQAAQEAEQQLPILRDAEITNYVNDVGQRLVRAIPEEYQHPEFRYSFRVVNAKEVNAFALPGGPMYVNSGMIMAARNEGEMAGVMAHELSHVALRHGTAQATKAQKYSILGGVGAILGGVIGGGVGSVIGQGSQTAVGVYFLKFSREYETQADILGAQIMARAGYDPNDLANVFRTLQEQGGGGGPQFLSDHPNPANRYARINEEARLIGTVRNPIKNTPDFQRARARLSGGSYQNYPSQNYPTESGRGQDYPNYPSDTRRGRVPRPSGRYRQIRGEWFALSIPDNWRDYATQTSQTYAPDGGADANGGITHGVIIGVAQQQVTRDLRTATDQYVSQLLQENSYLRAQSNGYARAAISGRTAYAITLVGRSPITGRDEQVTVVTTLLRDGRLFYFDAIVPLDEADYYRATFNNVLRSIQLGL
ncbi:MAG TPA: M48 family metalloprotease [Pyrinomonadaceae bacterium]